MTALHEVLVSSRNRGKLAEFGALLAALPLRVVSAAERGVPEVDETGTTLEQNACLKAAAAYCVSPGVCIADDSGLFVDALDGAPGVYSARFAGPDVTYEDNNRELLRRLSGIPTSERGAAFVSVMALMIPTAMAREAGVPLIPSPNDVHVPDDAALFLVEGRVQGRITEEVRGVGGFGYDPIFHVTAVGQTYAEMDSTAKNKLSHRALALARLRSQLEALFLKR